MLRKSDAAKLRVTVETIKTKTVFVQTMHRGIRLPRAAMESLPHPQQLYAAV